MFGLLSQESKLNVMRENITDNDRFLSAIGSGDISFGGTGNATSVANVSFPVPSTNPFAFDFDISQINTAASKGKGSAADIRSAYELFSTGQTQGRALGYAQDIQRRFSSGLQATYGSTDIRTAAANYLDSVGLPRLAQIVSSTPDPVETKPKDTTPIDEKTIEKDNPFELLIDAFTRAFGNATYNPPLQSQSSGYTGVEQGTPLAEATGGSNVGTFVIIGFVGVIAYFLYKRFAG